LITLSNPTGILTGVGAVGVQAVGRNVNVAAPDFNIPHWWSQLKVPGLRPSMSVDDLVNHLGNCISEQITSGNPALANNEVPTKETLEGIAQYLLGDTQGPPVSASDERSLMARVDSLCCLIQKDTAPVAKPKPEPNDSDSIGTEASDGSDEEFSSAGYVKKGGFVWGAADKPSPHRLATAVPLQDPRGY